MLHLTWRDEPSLPCRKRDWSHETSKLSCRGTNSRQSTSKKWEKQSVWVPRGPQCLLEEKPLPAQLPAKRALLFTLRGYPHGIIAYEWARAGLLRDLRLDRYCRWDLRG